MQYSRWPRSSKTFFWGLITFQKLLVVFHRKSMEEHFVFLLEACFQCSCTICDCFYNWFWKSVELQFLWRLATCLYVVPFLWADSSTLHLEPVPVEWSKQCAMQIWPVGIACRINRKGLDRSKGRSEHAEQIRLAFWMPLLCHSLHAVSGFPSVKQMLSQVSSTSGSHWCGLHCM